MTRNDTTPLPSEERVAAHLQAEYGIGDCQATRLQSWNPFVLRVDGGGMQPWVARIFPSRRPLDSVRGDAEILRYLASVDFPAERLAHERSVSSMDAGNVIVTEFLEGELLEDAIVEYSDDDRLRLFARLGDMLARIHALPVIQGAVSREAGAWHGDLAEGLPNEEIKVAKATFESIVNMIPKKHRSRFDALKAQLYTVPDCSDLPRSFVHPDFSGPNVVVRSEDPRLVAVDWTGAGRGPRIYSLAWLLMNKEKDEVEAVVKAYSRHVRLDDDELARLHEAMWARRLFFACRQFGRAIAHGVEPKSMSSWCTEEDNLRSRQIAETVRACLNR